MMNFSSFLKRFLVNFVVAPLNAFESEFTKCEIKQVFYIVEDKDKFVWFFTFLNICVYKWSNKFACSGIVVFAEKYFQTKMVHVNICIYEYITIKLLVIKFQQLLNLEIHELI